MTAFFVSPDGRVLTDCSIAGICAKLVNYYNSDINYRCGPSVNDAGNLRNTLSNLNGDWMIAVVRDKGFDVIGKEHKEEVFAALETGLAAGRVLQDLADKCLEFMNKRNSQVRV